MASDDQDVHLCIPCKTMPFSTITCACALSSRVDNAHPILYGMFCAAWYLEAMFWKSGRKNHAVYQGVHYNVV